MKIEFIRHSCNIIEFDNCQILFDYTDGKLPIINKPLIVFVSHDHSDHYNPDIFRMFDNNNTYYILSDDINYHHEHPNIKKVSPNKEYDLNFNNINLKVKTLLSTDKGVAYIIEINNKKIYFAADLHLWLWNDEDEKDNNIVMEAKYYKELIKLKDEHFDLAFLVLDPRQEELMYLGITSFLNISNAEKIIPIHFENNFKNNIYAHKYISNKIINITHNNQIIEI